MSFNSDTPTPSTAVHTAPLLSQQLFRSRPRFLRRPPSFRGAARFLRRASSRTRSMREPSVRVREAAAEQIEERQSDWAYSKPIVFLDLIWNLAFVIVSTSVLIMSCYETPSVPLRLWIVGYALQCILHIVCVCAGYKKRYSHRNFEEGERDQFRHSRNYSNLSSGSDDGDSGDYVSEGRQSDDETRATDDENGKVGIFAAEVWFGLYWILTRSLRWNRVYHNTFKDKLSIRFENDLPGVDIFVCTADPELELPMMVINTVLSVMAYDYPPQNLSVYLSDDAASHLTFYALLEASYFAKHWIPFCKRFKLQPPSSEAYFRSVESHKQLEACQAEHLSKGFWRTNAINQVEQRALYLNSVLTHRSGSVSMLSLIYSEILKMLRLWDVLTFDEEIFFPRDSHSIPRGYQNMKSKESDQSHIMTSQALLVEILRDLKHAFWPFQLDHTRSPFIRAAQAAHCFNGSTNTNESALELASEKAARHRMQRGVWTSVRFGDMRRALSACERLILLKTDPKELRDYAVLLYHCGFYEESLQYFKLYQDDTKQSDSTKDMEEEAVEKLIIRLNLILMEAGWSRQSDHRSSLFNNSDPW